ncbi:hypothetical protein M2323_004286 [Rhodoblastus acidophilus]|uniref:hypothetical protein n=1 Tax=Rhodoblastus acidophilus TaxID=1074 RepID=UPI0022248812|nr:hypothetical protein [Rhodoblastus acidophilus]MCW2286473.1 hypothetical protein [Rhodoblastus acidophilus]MCW2335339.1 hypothetical protein [Rhodoblastus acidophilus]
MTYLHPPPGDAPVIVTKDVGGYVDQYAAMTRLYAETGREVRLHECRSACTLALSLPNVCVYPSSLLKFHKAYNPLNKEANDEVSDQLMASYPAAVRERLGELTRTYKVLTGSELIRLGIRDCNRPAGPAYAVARARPKPGGAEPGFLSKVAEMLSPTPTAVRVEPRRAQVAAAPVKPTKPEPAAPPPEVAPSAPPAAPPEAAPAKPEPTSEAPLPPVRPADLTPPPVAPPPASPQVAVPEPPSVAPETGDVPTPPTRPADLNPPPAQVAAPAPPIRPPEAQAPAWTRRIAGSAPILATARFAPFFYRLLRKG